MLIQIREFKERNRPPGGIMLVVSMAIIFKATDGQLRRFDRNAWNSTGRETNGNNLTWGEFHP